MLKFDLLLAGRDRIATEVARPRRRLEVELLEDRLVLTGQPFVEPPAIHSVNGVLSAVLTQAQGPAQVGDTAVVNAWTYNGSYVGPTLYANPGDLLDLIIVNEINEPTNLHTHGLHVSPLGNSDNVLLQIEPGEENHYRIQIPDSHPEGLYWYHPHHHGFVNDQISMGLSGLLVIGRPDGGFPELDGRTQHLLALKNALLAGNQINIPAMGSDVSAQTFTVNGQLQPVLDIPVGNWDVFNIANIGNNSFYQPQVINLATGLPVTVYLLAEDGNPFNEVRQMGPIPPSASTLGLPPGRRWSFTFAPPTAGGNAVAGSYLVRTIGFNDGSNNWPAVDLMTINYVGSSIPTPPPAVFGGMPLSPPTTYYTDLRQVPLDQIAVFRTVVFGVNGQYETINGEPFPNNPLFQPRLGTVEEWTLINPTADDHPFHLHTNPQQVTAAPNPPNQGGLNRFQDVVNVPAGATVKIRVKYDDYLGTIVYHCHRVDHEDHGMMAQVNILPEKPTYAVAANPGSAPLVRVFNPVTDAEEASFLAFTPTFKGGVTTAVGDVNGDGVYDVIAAVASGAAGRVKVIDGTKLHQVGADGQILDAALLGNFIAYTTGFKGGVFVAAGDINGDGLADVITGSGPGSSPRVKVVNATQINFPSGVIPDSALLADFLAFGSTFRGGVRVAVGDPNGNGRIDIIVGTGKGAGRVKAIDGTKLHHLTNGVIDAGALLADFTPYGSSYTGGVFVGTGNIKGYAFTDILTGSGTGSRVKVFANVVDPNAHMNGGGHGNEGHLHLEVIDDFNAYASSYTKGVKVTSLQLSGNDNIVTTRTVGDGTLPSVFSL